MENRVRYDLVCDKIGFDWANKKMIIRVYDALKFMMDNYSDLKKNWTNTIRTMFVLESNEAGLKNIAINGYYSTIRTILKDIGVIEYKGRTLVKGPNWDRFYSDEDWSWFKTSTQCGGWGEIVK
jgi:hypothetical protein